MVRKGWAMGLPLEGRWPADLAWLMGVAIEPGMLFSGVGKSLYLKVDDREGLIGSGGVQPAKQ